MLGPVLQPGFESGVGELPIALAHGMTIGELGNMFANHFLPNASSSHGLVSFFLLLLFSFFLCVFFFVSLSILSLFVLSFHLNLVISDLITSVSNTYLHVSLFRGGVPKPPLVAKQ